MTQIYDLIIIGAGPAGLTAALYALRARMNILVIDKAGTGGQALIIDNIENFPGFSENSSGFVWVEKIETQLKQFDFNVKAESVKSISPGEYMTVITDQNSYQTDAIICSTGAEPKKIGVKGEQEFVGKGVSYCATCDGPFFKNKHVVVVGGGDTAVKDALVLTRFAHKITLVHRRDRLRAEKIMQEQLLSSSQVTVEWNSSVSEIKGSTKVEKIKLTNIKTNNTKDLSCDGVFVLIGITPATAFLQGLVKTDSQGFIETNAHMETSKPGIFAAGDCRIQLLRQIITACGDGATAAYAAQHYVDAKKGKAYGEFKP
ncbi:MAG: thioredoxin-disulfide reductase [bacterium]